MSRPAVLLVEDSEPIRMAFTVLLEESGYTVIPAGDAEEAVEAALVRTPDLVLLDLGLPGTSGVHVARTLKARPETAHVPIVALTGRDEESQRAACFEAGCTDFLVKPVDTRKLLGDIPLYISRGRG